MLMRLRSQLLYQLGATYKAFHVQIRNTGYEAILALADF
jgi:hypothetical protein